MKVEHVDSFKIDAKCKQAKINFSGIFSEYKQPLFFKAILVTKNDVIS